jgi:hypothetical protein
MSHPQHRRTILAAALVAVALAAAPVLAQQPQGAQGARPQGGPGGGGAPRALTVPYDFADTTGFVRIFDGTLKNWDGDPTFWRADSMMIIGESTPEHRVTLNNFIIWRGGVLRDFELKVEARLTGTNSGIQVRSRQLPDSVGKWVLAGYQADMDAANMYPGNLHEERGNRAFIAPRGGIARDTGSGPSLTLGSLGSPVEMKGLWNNGGWNQYHIIARGNMIMVILNGRVTSIFIDEDRSLRALEGLLGFQMHVGPPFTVQYRNVFLRELH